MSLYNLERNEDIEGISDLLRSSDKETIRERAAKILGRFPREVGSKAVKALLNASMEDESKDVRIAAVESLSRLEEENAITEIISSEGGFSAEDSQNIIDTALRGVESDESVVRAASVSLLGMARGTEASKKAMEVLEDRKNDSSVKVREVTARVLEDIDNPVASGTLVSMADDSSPRVRREVASSLAAHKNPGVKEAVLELSEDSNPEVRRAAVSTLGEFAGKNVVEATAKRITEDEASIGLSAAFSLIEVLSNSPTGRSHEIRKFAGELIEESAVGGSTAEALTDVLDAQERVARRNAAWLLGKVSGSNPKVINSLIDALGDEDNMTAQFSAKALGNIGGDKVRNYLIEALKEDEEIRSMVVMALGEVGGEKVEGALSRLVDRTEDDDVREKAFKALSKIDESPGNHI